MLGGMDKSLCLQTSEGDASSRESECSGGDRAGMDREFDALVSVESDSDLDSFEGMFSKDAVSSQFFVGSLSLLSFDKGVASTPFVNVSSFSAVEGVSGLDIFGRSLTSLETVDRERRSPLSASLNVSHLSSFGESLFRISH